MDIKHFETELWYMFKIMKDGTKKFFTPMLEKHDLTHIQVCILFGLQTGEFNTIGELAENIMANQGNASTICKKMEQQGFLNRTRSCEDERVVLLTLTEAGENKILDFQNSIRQNLDYLSEYINTEQLDTIINGFAEFNNLLKIVNKLSENNN